jgi:hypothetical protein
LVRKPGEILRAFLFLNYPPAEMKGQVEILADEEEADPD